MTLGKRAGGTLIGTIAMTAAVIALGAAPALASTPLTVKITNGGKFTAKATKTVLSDNGTNVTCSSKGSTPASSATGNIPSGTKKGNSPVKIGTTTNLKFNNCVSIAGAVTTKVESEPYFVEIDSKTNSKGQTAGIIGNVKVKVSTFGCTFMVKGTAPGYYTNSKHTLTMTPKLPVKTTTKAQLTVSGVVGCLTLVHNGDHPTFKSVYTLSRKGTIKSS